MKQFRIVGRFIDDEKAHVLDSDWKWTKEDAEKRMKEIIRSEERRGNSLITQAGPFSVKCEGVSKLVDVRIQSRDVTPWKDE